jgi:hypothetical protein
MDSGAEHIRETRAKILAAKKEIKEYLRLPEDARGLLFLTHGKGNVIFLSQENLPTGAERKYTWEEHSGHYTTQLITVYDYESMYMTAVDVDGNESATFVCLCLAQEKGVRFALERNKRMKNDYALISNHGGICIMEQTRENGIWLQLPEPDRNLIMKNKKNRYGLWRRSRRQNTNANDLYMQASRITSVAIYNFVKMGGCRMERMSKRQFDNIDGTNPFH